MSKQRQAQRRQVDRRAPIRKAQPTRPSASGPGDRIAKPHDIAIYFREDCRTLDDSLQLEMVAAQYQLQLNEVRTPQGIPIGDAACAGVVANLEEHDDALSRAILTALAHVGTGDTARRSADAAARLIERGIGIPAKFGDVASARALGAWRLIDHEIAGQYALFLEFEHPLGRRHSIAVFAEPRRGGVIKHIGLMHSMTDFESDEPFHPHALEPVEVMEGAELLHQLVDRTWGRELPNVDDYRILIAAARARSTLEQR